jgi:hypothetical protein
MDCGYFVKIILFLLVLEFTTIRGRPQQIPGVEHAKLVTILPPSNLLNNAELGKSVNGTGMPLPVAGIPEILPKSDKQISVVTFAPHTSTIEPEKSSENASIEPPRAERWYNPISWFNH